MTRSAFSAPPPVPSRHSLRSAQRCATRLSQDDFERCARFISERIGIRLPPAKKVMLEARLRKRMAALGLENHEEYCRYLFSDAGQARELPHLYDAVTTNTTNFFREPRHFEILTGQVLPALAARLAPLEPLTVWSAGCSTGEEPYTLAMVLAEYAARVPAFRYEILATDISNRVLAEAARGVYAEAQVQPVSPALRHKYLRRGGGPERGQLCMGPELRARVRFRRLNFMQDFDLGRRFHLIFCRNVAIYFDRPTQMRLFAKFCDHLLPGGCLFIGHSESLGATHGLPLRTLAPTVYERLDDGGRS
ncbi:MAG: protein-glutamate O-methyltransferase CheR [Desulfovibrionaceae bacterium]